MVDDRPDDAAESGRPKRPPPTLELSATEIPSEDPAGEAAANPEMPVENAPRRAGSIVAATLAGALAGALVVALAWFAGSPWLTSAMDPQPVPPSQVNTARLDDVTARLTRLEQRPAPQAPAAPPAPDLSAINARLDALDKAAATLRDENAALSARSSQALSAATDAQKDIKATPKTAAPDLTAVTTRLTQLETAARSQSDKLAEQARKPVDELATRRIAAASLLDAQVRASEPYGAALSAAKTLAADPAKLVPLDAFAAGGVPRADALARALLDMPQVAPPPSTATSGGLVARLQASASKLVTIERTDSPNADNAAFMRAADAARLGDISAAARELAALPASERLAVQPWLDKVASRDAARAASRQFADEALAAMPKDLPKQATQ